MTLFAITLGLGVVIFVLAPFWLMEPRVLDVGGRLSTLPEIEEAKAAVLQDYAKTEKEFLAGNLSLMAWRSRELFLTSRYVDLSKQEDRLKRRGESCG